MRLHKSNFFKQSVLFLSTAFLLMDIPGLAVAGDDTAMVQGDKSVLEHFSTYDAQSQVTVNHKPLTDMLAATVFPMGRSQKRLGPQGRKDTYKISHIIYGNYKPSRYESNRLMVHAFTDDIRAFYRGYQLGLERLSLRRPLAALNKNEQLAYWLNLYNVVVINKVVQEYPVNSLKSLKEGEENFWHQKTTRVEGIPLSLSDIENILFENFKSPLVIYGLFQGAVGGPSLPREAFTGKNVWRLLKNNATEFVNSNRGVRPKKGVLEVSIFYRWVKRAFGNSDQAVLNHIIDFSDPNFLGDLSAAAEIRYDYYDWMVADMVGGIYHIGQHNQAAALIGQDPALLDIFWETNSPIGSLNMPPSALRLLEGIFKNNDLPYRIPRITTKECEPGDPCEADPEHNPDSNIESKDDQLFSRPGP